MLKDCGVDGARCGEAAMAPESILYSTISETAAFKRAVNLQPADSHQRHEQRNHPRLRWQWHNWAGLH